MKEQFVSLAIAQKLKEKGFDQSCMAYVYTGNTGTNVDQYVYGAISHDGNPIHENYNVYDMSYSLPLWQQAIDWLKSKGILITELWDGWEYAKLEEDFTWVQTKEQAIEHALTLI